jgi:hypothetical protein
VSGSSFGQLRSRWEGRAREARNEVAALGNTEPHARRALEGIAATYDELARDVAVRGAARAQALAERRARELRDREAARAAAPPRSVEERPAALERGVA